MGVNESTIMFVINHILLLIAILLVIFIGVQGFKYFVNRTKKTEKKLDTILNNSEVCCPKCGSTQLSKNKKELVKTAGSIGGGGLGLVTRYVEITCLKCGNKFKEGK
jgi:DNA-directed RNA polymerase subunit RPC12/RpoP